jgi:hypothetical protein
LRYPAMMPTISAASIPSRSMIRNATSKNSSFQAADQWSKIAAFATQKKSK